MRDRSGAGCGGVGCGAEPLPRRERSEQDAERAGGCSSRTPPVPRSSASGPARLLSSVLGSTVDKAALGELRAPQQLWVWQQRSGKRNRPKLSQSSPDSDFFSSLRCTEAQLGWPWCCTLAARCGGIALELCRPGRLAAGAVHSLGARLELLPQTRRSPSPPRQRPLPFPSLVRQGAAGGAAGVGSRAVPELLCPAPRCAGSPGRPRSPCRARAWLCLSPARSGIAEILLLPLG